LENVNVENEKKNPHQLTALFTCFKTTLTNCSFIVLLLFFKAFSVLLLNKVVANAVLSEVL